MADLIRMEPDMTTLGGMLTTARRAKGWSLRETEKRSGVSNAHLSQIETGTISSPAGSILLALANSYGMDPRPLLEAAGEADLASLIGWRDRWQALRDWLGEQVGIAEKHREGYRDSAGIWRRYDAEIGLARAALARMTELEEEQ